MQLNVKLERPIIFFDLETTGLNITSDRIIELSYIKVFPDGREQEHTQRINPGMPIPDESRKVHHISDADVAGCPTFAEVAGEIASVFAGCDIAGFSSNQFDIPLLDEEFHRAGVSFDWTQCKFIDVQVIFHKKERRDLAAACMFYCGHEMENHHSALADTRTTLEVFKAQLRRYDDLGDSVEALSRYSSHRQYADLRGLLVYSGDRVIINFGKHRGKPLDDALREDRGYAAWVLQRDFPASTKQLISQAWQRIRDEEAEQRRIDEQKPPTDEQLALLMTKNNKLT